jgi:hypothetical protein
MLMRSGCTLASADGLTYTRATDERCNLHATLRVYGAPARTGMTGTAARGR